jgi:hypothetical protein
MQMGIIIICILIKASERSLRRFNQEYQLENESHLCNWYNRLVT